MMCAPQLHGRFRHGQVEGGDFKMRFKKIPQLSVILLCADQHFHPGDAADEHLRIALVFCIGSSDAVEGVDDQVGIEDSLHE